MLSLTDESQNRRIKRRKQFNWTRSDLLNACNDGLSIYTCAAHAPFSEKLQPWHHISEYLSFPVLLTYISQAVKLQNLIPGAGLLIE